MAMSITEVGNWQFKKGARQQLYHISLPFASSMPPRLHQPGMEEPMGCAGLVWLDSIQDGERSNGNDDWGYIVLMDTIAPPPPELNWTALLTI